MKGHIREAVDKTGHTPEELRSNKFSDYLREVLPEGEDVPMKLGKRGNIPALAKDDDGCKMLLAHLVPEVRDLMLARQAVKSWPLHTARIENMEHQAEANGGTLRVPLNYYGGHTGRWSGGEDINLQNFGGRGRAGTGIDPLIGQMRGLLRAPDGYTLGIGDSAQIEVRILAWLAGQDDLLKGFANGEDIYSEFAMTLFRTRVRKPKKSDPKPVARLLDIRRGFGKDTVLGAGFGLGGERFYKNCLQNPPLRPLFDNGTYDRKFIDRLIKVYRETYPEIPAYWTSVERAFKQAIKYQHLKPKVGAIEFSCSNSEVQIKLPSGRVLYYRHCRIDKSGTIKYHHGALWGGSITENIVQSVARDLLGYWILACEDAGLPVVLHVHDEVVTLFDYNGKMLLVHHGHKMLEKLQSILCSLPAWAEGLPVGAEVKESEVYCK
jgi:DNA polymerase